MKIELSPFYYENDTLGFNISASDSSFSIEITSNKAMFCFEISNNISKEEYDKALTIFKILKRIKKFEKLIGKIKEDEIKDGLVRLGLETDRDLKINHNFNMIGFPLKEKEFTISCNHFNEYEIGISMEVGTNNFTYITYKRFFSLEMEFLYSKILINSKAELEENYFYVIKRMEIFLRLYSKALLDTLLKSEEPIINIKYNKENGLSTYPNDNKVLHEFIKSSQIYKDIFKMVIWEKWRNK